MLLVALFILIVGVLSSPLSSRAADASNMDASASKPKSRFPLDSQTAEQKAAFAEAERLVLATLGSSFKLKDDQGNLLGPFGILSYTPKTFLPYLNYTSSYTSLTSLTAKERELSVLATASVTKSDYILYAHKSIGISVGLTKRQAEDAADGDTPDNLSDREEFVYELALKMAKKFGVLSDKQFKEAVDVIGREGIAQLSQVVGGYLLSSVLVNVADVPVPTS
jgi:hypothetical protein